ncbi:hypothetical protein ASPZODRAFT_109735 [Penicilliopsis zonata CBS 506.65]|uniref:Atos-like conserved domain-containing protein n=1 Tax=Penicilliopsis zonata CBS 506.65 TaxID=1073090 RepID=A0A1L9SRP3_9EURO|nr:hypothetical protein ASPZODRAFT_109735 [Penicilliopsis zonata CBS 506.65]OJJ49890.1 hypothetical protein ASPZODRAFT_109735 [Penicilliopsis zonata CBS 506.65]
MPIFHDPDRQQYDLWSTEGGRDDKHIRRSREISSTRRRFDEATDWELGDTEMSGTSAAAADRTTYLDMARLCPDDRDEVIFSIKRSQRFAWMHDLASDRVISNENWVPEPSPKPKPLGDVTGETTGSDESLRGPPEIERPKSAMHSGDFREGDLQSLHLQDQSQRIVLPRHADVSPFDRLGSSPTTPWYTPSFSSALLRSQAPSDHPFEPAHITPIGRSRAPSLGSFSSSYVLKAPTSPLVHQANNTDLDFSPMPDFMDMSADRSSSPTTEKATRRRTLPPETFRKLQASPSAPPGSLNFHATAPSVKRGQSFNHQSHHPRRSLTSAYSLQLASSIQPPWLRARRPSFASDASPKHHAPMVGSYEESILRGRMSMNPSKPLDFTAQIGVLGKGKCKANLKCPPHVSVPFPAVFYSYPTSGSGRSISDDSPSPYVGMIDLENSLPKDDSKSNKSRRNYHHYHPHPTAGEEIWADSLVDSVPTSTTDKDARRRREKRSRRAESPRCPPGGCYRIPQQGQLQIMIKNPNKTAVKLFLVPYDLSDMEPGTKTFIRQRSYSAGPVIDMPLTARKNLGTDRPEASLNATEDPHDKPILRYLVHLNICCPSRGRFYLYSTIRVVFANRVPDGKERLRNEIQLPDPRYSPYKVVREPVLNASAKLAAQPAHRRRSVCQQNLVMNGPGWGLPSQKTPSPLTESSPPWRGAEHSSGPGTGIEAVTYYKLSKGDSRYGGVSGSSDAGESLLAKRLGRLDVQKSCDQ